MGGCFSGITTCPRCADPMESPKGFSSLMKKRRYIIERGDGSGAALLPDSRDSRRQEVARGRERYTRKREVTWKALLYSLYITQQCVRPLSFHRLVSSRPSPLLVIGDLLTFARVLITVNCAPLHYALRTVLSPGADPHLEQFFAPTVFLCSVCPLSIKNCVDFLLIIYYLFIKILIIQIFVQGNLSKTTCFQ